ncbi:putative mating type protein 1-1-1 protein [Phaeoacremonium minimum UCRPA7]|uniref:Putative mating type protein 1-1-1 protein n=1 Tax=Phaeoacremonium minimum (strain UCR-PA7) TaxID=1286976 RepID=R8BPS8_PHAM7|nr:putative mating type protein 1-1-1 protein [Phaeoacremonium minimum UCRPA7]EOO01344.1 putative mating type protein 1-1-1 protein [Phaeoacremonium minimum UCRPA7]
MATAQDNITIMDATMNDDDAIAALPETDALKHSKGVNAFIAFRVYYSGAFPSMTQRFRSSLIKQMWAKDPYHTTWKLLGKVFTTIRDYVVDVKPNLADFLRIACPHLGIVAPDDYLGVFHWQFAEVNGEVKFVHDDNVKVTVKGPDCTSEYDIVLGCINNGFQIKDHQGLLERMQSEPEKTLSFMPDAETHRGHFENLVLMNPHAAIGRIMDGDAAIGLNNMSVNVVFVDSDNNAGQNGSTSDHGSFARYGGIQHMLTQEALMVDHYDWENAENRPPASPYGVNGFAVQQSDWAVFDMANPICCDRLADNYSATNDDETANSVWEHDSMTIKPVPPPN